MMNDIDCIVRELAQHDRMSVHRVESASPPRYFVTDDRRNGRIVHGDAVYGAELDSVLAFLA